MKSGKEPRSNHVQTLSLPLGLIKGVGPKRAAMLELKGLYTILDLFYFTPIRYQDRSVISPINRVEDGRPSLVKGRVIEGKEDKFYPGRKRIYRIRISDDAGETLELVWFHYVRPHLAGFSRPGQNVLVYGVMKTGRDKRQMLHPDIRILESGMGYPPGFIPVYGSINGISDNVIRTIIRSSIDNYLKDLIDPLPGDLLSRLDLPGLRESVEGIHIPPRDYSIEALNSCDTPFHKRLVFDRFFYLMLIMAFRKKRKETTITAPYLISRTYKEDMKGFFKFDLTSDQVLAVEEITRDLMSGHPMNRMLMGGVGTGKTAVAAIAAHITVMNNHQAALMAPTQILAEQHMDYFSSLPEKMGFRPVLLTGDMKKSEREKAYQKIRDMQCNMVIGTHSLIREDLVFADLGLAVIDEEHRFGVRQRAMMDRKGNNPHVLVMTATPIPRSIAITVYGDMDISMIKQYPKGRIPVVTRLIEKTDKRWAFETLKECLRSKRQAFVICPVIETTEDSDLKGAQEMYVRLKKLLNPTYKVGIVHGRMSPDEREETMYGFYKGTIDILVATTVVEVGVHVPNATMMVIEHPERFGLAQLHQLRGRVGRGVDQGLCAMIMSDNLTENSEARLKCLVETHDGFEIAQRDLELRGHGELTGIRQSGIGELDLSDVIAHQELLLEAKRCAQDLIGADPCLAHPDNFYLRMITESVSGVTLDR